MSIKYVIFFVSTLVAVESQINANSPCITISGEGFTCADSCTKLIHCIPTSNTTVAEHVARTCPGGVGSLCNPASRDCTATSCDDNGYYDQPFVCAETGRYPDPWRCQYYYTCTGTGPAISARCPLNTAYNGQGENCTKEALLARSCTETPLGLRRCESLDDVGGYPDNNNVFYICSYNSFGYLVPQLRKCRKDFHFDDDDKKCLPNSASLIGSSFAVILSVVAFVQFRI